MVEGKNAFSQGLWSLFTPPRRALEAGDTQAPTLYAGGEQFLFEAGWRRKTEAFVARYTYVHYPGSIQWR